MWFRIGRPGRIGRDAFFLCLLPILGLYQTRADSKCMDGSPHRLQNSSGVITIPRYADGKYKRLQNCHWLITAPSKNHIIHVHLPKYSISSSPECKFDYLIAYDGEDQCAPPFAGYVCGTGRDLNWTSSGPHIYLTFRSQSFFNALAFDIHYSTQEGIGERSSSGGSKKMPTDGIVQIRGRFNCTKNLTASEADKGMYLHVDSFNRLNQLTVATHVNCAKNRVLMYNRTASGDWYLNSQFCGRGTYYSSAPYLLARFVSVDRYSYFYAAYGDVDKTSWMEKPTSIAGESGMFSVDDAVAIRTTPVYDVFAWHIRAPFGTVLSLNWTLSIQGRDGGFIIVKEGSDTTFHNIFEQSDLDPKDVEAFRHSLWLQRDLKALSSKRNPLQESGQARIDYFECLLVLGVKKTNTTVNFKGQYTSSPLSSNRNVQLCKEYIIDEKTVKDCSKSSGPFTISTQSRFSLQISRFFGQPFIYARWLFVVEEGKYGRVGYGEGVAYAPDRLYDSCEVAGLIVEEMSSNGHRKRTIGPFCPRDQSELFLSTGNFSVIFYWNTRRSSLEPTLTFSSTFCKGLFIEPHQSLPAVYNITGETCARLQHPTPVPAQTRNSAIAYVQTNDPNMELDSVGPYDTQLCRNDPPSVSKQRLQQDLHQYLIKYQHKCISRQRFWFAQFKTSLATDCDFYTVAFKDPINSYCGFLRFFSQIVSFMREPVILTISFQPQKRPSTPYFYRLKFHILHLKDASISLDEEIFPTDNQPVSMPQPRRRYFSYIDVNKTDFTIDTIRTDKIIFTILIDGVAIEPRFSLDYDVMQYAAVKEVGCPAGFLQYSGHCYVFSDMTGSGGPKTWREAERHCSHLDATLASVTSEDEMAAIKRFLDNHWARSLFSKEAFMVYIGLHSRIKAGYHKWVDGNPMIYAEWYLPGMMNYTSARVWEIIKRDYAQPLLESSAPCTAMLPVLYPRLTNWAKVPCNFQPAAAVGVGYICKKPIHGGGEKRNTSLPTDHRITGWVEKTENRNRFLHSGQHCPEGWLFLGGDSCFYIDMADPKTWEEASVSCREQQSRGRLMSGEKKKIIGSLLGILKINPKQNLFIGKNPMKPDHNTPTLCPTIVHTESGLAAPKDELVACGRQLPYICESEPLVLTKSCSEQQYACSDGTCISNANVCDGSQDCLGGEDEQSDTCSALTFTCTTGQQRIPISFYCDHEEDCADGSDERCFYRPCAADEFRCRNQACIPRSQRCNFAEDCRDGSDESAVTCSWGLQCGSLGGFLCHYGNCLPPSQLLDHTQDCKGRFREDEAPSAVSKYGITPANTCRNSNNTFRCENNAVEECITSSQVCVYDYDSRRAVVGCSTFGHLHNCNAYECPAAFKCPKSYCIPNRLVCDGTWDCLDGWDEKDCSNFVCPGMFRCKNEQRCLDQRVVCDGTNDCRQKGEDELFCDFLTCPAGCTCIGYFMNCSSLNMDTMPTVTKELRSLVLSDNMFTVLPLFAGFYRFGVLDLSSNSLDRLPAFAFRDQRNLFYLNIANNNLTYLQKNTFWGLNRLVTLHLHGNPLKYLESESFFGLNIIPDLQLGSLQIAQINSGVFLGLTNLKHLSLKNNKIRLIESGAFIGLDNLIILNLERNEIKNLSDDTFKPLRNLQNLRSDAFEFCCKAAHAQKCTPGADEFSSCSDLLSSPYLQVTTWIIGVTAFMINLFVIIWRCHSNQKNVLSLLLMNLALSDFIRGLGLIVVASVDVLFRGEYIQQDNDWRSSAVCKLVGLTSTLSSQMSVLVLMCIAMERLDSIMAQYISKSPRFEFRRMKIACGIFWVVWLLVSVLPLTGIDFFEEVYSRNGVCQPFALSANQWYSGWEYVTTVFVAFDLLAVLVIAICHNMVRMLVRKSKRVSTDDVIDDMKGSLVEKPVIDIDEIEIINSRRVSYVFGINVLCWASAAILHTLSMLDVQLPADVSAWLTVFFLPLPSALNPMLYLCAVLFIRPDKRKAKAKKLAAPKVQANNPNA